MAPAATAEGNRKLAEREASRLLGLTPLPPGAAPTALRPAAFDGPALGTPMAASKVDRSAYWSVPASMAATRAWLGAHPPAGLGVAGSSSGRTLAGPVLGVGWSDKPSPAWSGASLEVGLTRDGRVTVMRADAVVLWLDPRPEPARIGGARWRLTLQGGCPANRGAATGVQNPGPGLGSALLPDATPTGGLICSYNGLNGARYALRRTMRLDAQAATRIARAIRAISLTHVDNAVTSCPNDDDSVDVFVFGYAGQPDVDLWYARTGCSTLSNGRIVVRAYLDPTLDPAS